MNPNTAQTLDPKLKEVYDRVMGADVGARLQGEAADKGGTSTHAQPENSVSQHVPVEGIPVQNTPTPQPAPAQQPSVSTTPATEPQMVSINTSAAPAAKPASSKKISPVIFVVAGVGFFLLYTVVWLKVFKIF